ncbi:MAG: hypothetical protein NTX16_10835 [Actinobacteria bacterium]|nr:hypothetical protein [Actinomycetota bacterium]
MSSQVKREPIQVYLWEPGQGRPPFSFEPGPLEYLPSDAPLPQVGDTLLLPRNVTGDSKEQTFAWHGTLAPFRVIEVEHVYFRETDEKLLPANPRPARYVRTMIAVRRLTPEQFDADPGQAAG